ncbi:peptidylprolyl isomerase [Candidatus Omnitrophota bacterium]
MRNKLYLHITVVVFCAILLLTGCGKSDKDVLARIDNKHTITLGDFNDRIAKLPPQYQELINKNKKAFLDELIVDTLLYDEALSKKLDADKDVQGVLEEARKKILIAKLLQDEVEERATVTDVEIEAYYTENPAQFKVPELLRASHILVKTRKEAEDVVKQLAAGEKFEELAKERSSDPTSAVGGDIGYFAKGQLVAEVEDVCDQMRVGEVSDIVETDFGYHVIKLTERKEPHVKELAEVRDAIRQSLTRVKKKISFNNFVDNLKEKSRITINTELLESASNEEAPEEKPKD